MRLIAFCLEKLLYRHNHPIQKKREPEILSAQYGPRLTSQWTEFKGTVQGISEGITTTHWRPGTAKTGIVFFCQQPDAEIHLKDIRLEEEE